VRPLIGKRTGAVCGRRWAPYRGLRADGLANIAFYYPHSTRWQMEGHGSTGSEVELDPSGEDRDGQLNAAIAEINQAAEELQGRCSR
jgi:hypothetical protein